jgi:hypothetical protein
MITVSPFFPAGSQCGRRAFLLTAVSSPQEKRGKMTGAIRNISPGILISIPKKLETKLIHHEAFRVVL